MDCMDLRTVNQIKMTFESHFLILNFSDVRVRSTMNFNLGKCYTVRPASELVKEDYRDLGYSIELNHSLVDREKPAMMPPGWHVFIHEVDERFTGAF